jgi:malate synthase
MGGMAAQIPDRRNPAVNTAAFERVRADKEREAKAGHDGTWVAHPDLVPVAMEVFDKHMPKPNQLDRMRDEVAAGAADLLRIHEGTRRRRPVSSRRPVAAAAQTEDAATAEISRSQIWQQLHFGATLEDGKVVDRALFDRLLDEEMLRVKGEIGQEAFNAGRFPEAIAIFRDLSTAETLQPFLTLPAYKLIV